jgi:hypothetical protein
MRISELRKFLGEDNWLEYQRLRQKANNGKWSTNNSKHVIRWRQKKKKELIEYKGGKCQKCGYNKDCPTAYAFHHRDPKTKNFGIGSRGLCRSIKDLKNETDKCDLLCVRCHAELHDEEFEKIRQSTMQEPDRKLEIIKEARIKFLEEKLKTKTSFDQRVCRICSKDFKVGYWNQIYCSNTCSRQGSRKVDRPSKIELAGLIAQKRSWDELGKRFNVSGNAVRKWAKAYGLGVHAETEQ